MSTPSATSPTVAGGEEQPAVVLNQLVDAMRHTGRLGVVGLYLPKDPARPTRTPPRQVAVQHRPPMAAYARFDRREDGYSKVVLKP